MPNHLKGLIHFKLKSTYN